jgi:nitroreductase
MDVAQAIRKRRAVRSYTDAQIEPEVLDRVLSLGLRAPTGSGAQSWAFVVVQDAAIRAEIVKIVIDGASQYFALMRPKADGVSDEDHAAWGREYAETVLGSYPNVPVWVLGVVVPRRNYPGPMVEWGHMDDVVSVAFAMQNLMLAARAEGLGTVPTTAFWKFEEERLRSLLGLTDEVRPLILTPIGVPTEFPTGKAPALARTFKTWRSLVHDDRYGNVRESETDA